MITIRGSSLRPLQLNPLIEVINGQERSEKHLYEIALRQRTGILKNIYIHTY